MNKITRSLTIAIAVAATVPVTTGAWAADKYVGEATNSNGSVSYGKVTFTVSGSKIKKFKVEGATVSNGNCGGYKSVVVPTMKLKGSKIVGAYQPVPGVDDIISVNGTLKNGKARGAFTEGPLCQIEGRFTARRR